VFENRVLKRLFGPERDEVISDKKQKNNVSGE
jgi:hypothetical protein